MSILLALCVVIGLIWAFASYALKLADRLNERVEDEDD